MQLRNIGIAKCIVCPTNLTAAGETALPAHYVPAPLTSHDLNGSSKTQNRYTWGDSDVKDATVITRRHVGGMLKPKNERVKMRICEKFLFADRVFRLL